MADGRIRARGYNFEVAYNFFCERLGLLALKERALALAVASQHHVVDYIHVADESHAESVLGDER